MLFEKKIKNNEWTLEMGSIIYNGKKIFFGHITYLSKEDGKIRFKCGPKEYVLSFAENEQEKLQNTYDYIYSKLSKVVQESCYTGEKSVSQLLERREALRETDDILISSTSSISIKSEYANKYRKMAESTKTTKIEEYIWFNDEIREFIVFKKTNGFISDRVTDFDFYKYSDVLKFEIQENGNLLSYGGVGSAIAGGLLFGSVGAIVGAATGPREISKTLSELKVRVTINNPTTPLIWITLVENANIVDQQKIRQYYDIAQ